MVVETVPPCPDQGDSAGDACEIDVEHWQQVDRAIDLLAEVVIAGHKQEAQALAAELRCHIMSLGQNDKLWQLRLTNALQQAETLRMELQQTEGNLDQVTKGLEVAESERAAMVEELEMITQQLGSSLEAEKLCMELQELEDAEQNLDEVLKKQAEAAQKSADAVNFTEDSDHPAATADGQVQSSAYENMGKEHAEDGDEKEVQTDLEEEEEENSSTTTELENTCQEHAEHGDQEAQVVEDQVPDEETASTTTELENVNKETEEPAQVADQEESPVAEVTLEACEIAEEKGVEFQDTNPVSTAEGEKAEAEEAEQTDQQDLQETAVEKCEVDMPKPQQLSELGAAQISEVSEQEEAPVVGQVPKDEMPEGTRQKCEESAIISAMEKAKASIKAKVQITSESPAVQRPVEVPVPKNTSAMQAAEAALAAAARARQVSAQQLRQDEVVPTRHQGPMQDIRIATVRSIGQGTTQANSCTVPCNVSGKLFDQAPQFRGDIIQAIPTERSLGTVRTSSPCRVRESMPVPGYVQAQPAERSGYRRTVSPSRGHDASRLRETFPALPKRIIQGTRIVERTGLGNVRTLSPSGLRDGREGLRHTLQGYPQSNLVQGQPERSAQIRTGSPVAMYHRPEGCGSWDRSFAPKMPTSLTVPPAIPVQPMVLQMAGSFVAPAQPPCLGRSSSFTHIGMPQEQVIVSAPPGSPLLTYREPQRGQRTGSFVAMPMGRPNEMRASSPLRTRWEQDMYVHGRGNYPARARLPEETQYVGMARLSHHVRQHLQMGGVVETAAPVKHSTKMAL